MLYSLVSCFCVSIVFYNSHNCNTSIVHGPCCFLIHTQQEFIQGHIQYIQYSGCSETNPVSETWKNLILFLHHILSFISRAKLLYLHMLLYLLIYDLTEYYIQIIQINFRRGISVLRHGIYNYSRLTSYSQT